MTYDNFQQIPQRGSYRAFFVTRDPRDMVVSWYFSTRYNHVVDRTRATPLSEARYQLSTMGQADGLSWSVQHLAAQGRFDALESWTRAADDANVMLVRFEDLASQHAFAAFDRLLAFLDIRMPTSVVTDLVDAYSFRRLAGRDRDRENTRSHLRGGRAGNWCRYFSPAVERQFYEHTGDLTSRLGYD